LLFVGDQNQPLILALRRAGYRLLIGTGPGDLSEPIEGLRTVVIDADEHPDGKHTLIALLRGGAHASVPALVLAQPKSDLIPAADAFLLKPFLAADAVVQVGALVRMSRRFARARQKQKKAFAGDIALVSTATVLTIVALERRTGVFELSSPEGDVTSIRLVAGSTVSSTMSGRDRPVAETLRTMLGARRGRFSFHAEPEREAPPGAVPLREMLIEVARTIDEAARAAAESSGDRGGPRRA
jgi:hypothetical protein